MNEKRAAFWIAAGNQYTEEVRESASSFRSHNPGIPLYLFTPSPVQINGIQTIKTSARESEFWYLDSTRYFLESMRFFESEGIRKTIYFDTDTFICGQLGDLWDIQRVFDFSGAHAPGRRTRPTKHPIPPSFPEINIGVLAIRISPMMTSTVEYWYELYRENKELYGKNDQPSLRETLWSNPFGIRINVLPPEYNFRFGFGGWVRNRVFVLHGRHPDIRSVESRVNRKIDFRGWDRGQLG